MADNSGTNSVKKRVMPKGRPFVKGQSGNPKGAPKRGESWAEIIKRIGDMTPEEAAQYASQIVGKLRTIGGGVTLKEAVVLRVYGALLFEPTGSLFNALMDRTDGRIPQPVVGDKDSPPIQYKVIIEYADTGNTDTSAASALGSGASETRTDEV